MKLRELIAGGWRVELDQTTAVEFKTLDEARDFADLVEQGDLPRKALMKVLERKAREAAKCKAAKHNNT